MNSINKNAVNSRPSEDFQLIYKREQERISNKFDSKEGILTHKKTNFKLDLAINNLHKMLYQPLKFKIQTSTYFEKSSLTDFDFLVEVKKKHNKNKYNYKIVRKVLGEGTFGKVSEVFSLRGNTYALKIPITEGLDPQAAIQDVVNEIKAFEKLKISSAAPRDGLAKAPHQTLTMSTFTKPMFYKGALYPLYHTDAHDWTIGDFAFSSLLAFKDLPYEKKHIILGQLLSGVSHIHSCGYGHGDLKPENIFIEGSTQTPAARVGDLGGLTLLSSLDIPTHTTTLSSYADTLAMRNCSAAKQNSSDASLRDQFAQIFIKHDSFNLGTSLFMMFGKAYPYPLISVNNRDFQDISQPLDVKPLVANNVPTATIDIIVGLLESNRDSRINVEDAFIKWQNLNSSKK
jgi:serine/threonine protein kinase